MSNVIDIIYQHKMCGRKRQLRKKVAEKEAKTKGIFFYRCCLCNRFHLTKNVQDKPE